MTWKIQTNGYWLAQGSDGNFLVWNDKENWHGRYMSHGGEELELLPAAQSLGDMKLACRTNAHWED